jgi:microcystin-dependent protein
MEGVIAVVTTVAYDFAPKNWAFCNGQQMAIAQNQALFSLVGTTYGGNGVTTFALPDLRGRSPIGVGQGPGLSNITLGEVTGSENVSLSTANIPPHVHNGQVQVKLQADTTSSETTPDGFYPAQIPTGYASAAGANKLMQAPNYTPVVGTAGGGQPISVLQPYLVMNYVICLYGLFPSRN